MRNFRKVILAMSILIIGMPLFTSCGDDGDDEKIETPDYNGNSSDKISNYNVVGKSYMYYEVTNKWINGEKEQESMQLIVTFNSSNSYTVKKEAYYWKYVGREHYQQYIYTDTKTGSYSRSGNTLTLKSNWPYWNSGMCERWDDENWVLEVSENYLTNESGETFGYLGVWN